MSAPARICFTLGCPRPVAPGCQYCQQCWDGNVQDVYVPEEAAPIAPPGSAPTVTTVR